MNAYPLTWPGDWKRAGSACRQAGRFNRKVRENGRSYPSAQQLTVAEAVRRVTDELARMGIDRQHVIVSTNVRTRLDGMPRSGEKEPADPGAAVYWTSHRGAKRVLAIDQYTRVADNLAAIAATLEALRAVERHGGAAILDRAFTGFTALPAPIVAGMKRDWQTVLGLQSLLMPTADDVQQAYRRLAAKLHPDRGGDAEGMAELNAARDEALQELSR